MKKEIVIEKVYEPKRGTSQKGNVYCLTDLKVTWTEKEPGCNEQTHRACATISGEPDMELLNSAVANKKPLACTMYFDAREYGENKDKCMTSLRLYLPDGYVKKI